jgi:N-methylhydantoinase A
MTVADRTFIGIDVGGTFTDCVLTDGATTWRAKAPTTPGEIGKGVLAAAEIAAGRRGIGLRDLLPSVVRFGLGTTAVTNVLAARTGRSVGLLTTRGFEEMIPVARGARIVDDDGWLSVPAILSRRVIASIDERIDRTGEVVVPLDLDQLRSRVRQLVEEEGVEALAVSFLWSFANPTHEEQAASAIADLYPGMPVVSGAALHPAIREYERTTAAVLNAYVSGAFAGIEALEDELRAMGLKVPLLLVHSGGGSITIGEARRRPLDLAMSGPAAGVAAAAVLSQATGFPYIVTADMGGTSFDVSVITDGEPARRTRGDMMGVWTALSLVDVQSIGAGGGSLGWIDARSMLRVGPKSAGAVPGPACYQRGGDQATVTDALVVLGYIDPNRFLGGEFPLYPEAALAACERLGTRLGLGAVETAWGIRQLALAGMIKAVRGRMASLGLDPRQYAVLSYGGSGSLFTPDIARATGVPRVLVPELASVLSAFGAATTDIRRERIRSVLATMPVDAVRMQKLIAELDAQVREDLGADGVDDHNRSVVFEADLRFSKQIYELQMPVPGGTFDDDSSARLLDAFMDEYAKRYGKGSIVLRTPVELVSIRAIGVGRTVQASIAAAARPPVESGTLAEPVGTRRVRVAREADGVLDVDTYDGAGLRPGHQLKGPALVDSSDTTLWIPDGCSAVIDKHGTLLMEVAP